MNEETQKPETSQTPTEPTATVPEKTDEKSKELQSALAQKEHFREKAAKAEAERLALEAKLNELTKAQRPQGLNVEDYIDISSSLEGLDAREKEYVASQHKMSGKPIKDIRNSEDFSFWRSSYQQKLEKERTLKPSTTQPVVDQEITLEQALAEARSDDEREKLLKEHLGYSIGKRSSAERVVIGR